MTLAGSLVTDRAAWLAERQKGVGASEAASALGLSPFESPRELYLRKIGVLPAQEETEAMRWGTALEPLIAAAYTERTGRAIERQQVYLKSELTPLMATVDALCSDGMPVEFKAIGAWSARSLGEEDTDELPDHWLIQGHQQMLLTSTWRMDFAVLIGGQKLRVFPVLRDEGLVEHIIAGVREFWGCVERREAPPSDARADGRIMHLLYPGCEGEIELDEECLAAAEEYGQLGQDLGETKSLRDSSRAFLLNRLGNHAMGRLPDGRVITRKMVELPEALIRRKASKYVRLTIGRGAR